MSAAEPHLPYAKSGGPTNPCGHTATCEEASDNRDLSDCGRPAALVLDTSVIGGYIALCWRHRRYYAEAFTEHPVEGIPLAIIAARQAPRSSPAYAIARAVLKVKAEYDRNRRDQVPLEECWAEVEALAELLSPSRELMEAERHPERTADLVRRPATPEHEEEA